MHAIDARRIDAQRFLPGFDRRIGTDHRPRDGIVHQAVKPAVALRDAVPQRPDGIGITLIKDLGADIVAGAALLLRHGFARRTVARRDHHGGIGARQISGQPAPVKSGPAGQKDNFVFQIKTMEHGKKS